MIMVVLGLLRRRFFSRSCPAPLDTLATCVGSLCVGPDPPLGGIELTHGLESGLVVAGHDDRNVAGALENLSGPSTCTRPPTLQRRALVGVAGGDEELLGRDPVVVLSIGHGRFQQFADDVGHRALRERKDLGGTAIGLTAYEVEHLTGLGGRHTDVPGNGPGTRTFVGLDGDHQRLPPFSWPAWERKVRVGANSPSLWPTIDSVT